MKGVERHFHLGVAWARRGHPDRALAEYQTALRLDPAFVPALRAAAEALLDLGRASEALGHFARARALAPQDAPLEFRHRLLARQLEDALSPERIRATYRESGGGLPDQPGGKICLANQKRFSSHRSGWGFALDALAPLHHSEGTPFDGFIENNFAWLHRAPGVRPAEVLERMRREGTYALLATSEEKGITPYTRPWVGVIHNPPGMPAWYMPQDSPQAIFAKDVWKRSAKHCKGLFTLSAYAARWVRDATGLPVSALVSPTETPAVRFDFDRFAANRSKKIVQIGWWLRSLSAIYHLPVPRGNPAGYEKIRLVPHPFERADEYFRQLVEAEARHEGRAPEARFAENTREVQHVSDGKYDDLLAENIAFVRLYDASANNTVTECIARGTPLLINPLPAVTEYLGPSYPFYYDSLADAAEKAMDLDLIRRTHLYLLGCEVRPKLTAEFFRESFRQSEVYRGL
jgi:tetratricopeptide (TPR) repeat protein